MKNRLDRLLAYNRNRMVKAMRFNKNKADIYFKVLPFLLHSNYPDLPGYIEDEKCLFGIHRFQPEKVLDFELFRKFFPKSTALSERTPSPFTENPCIHSLKTIGSIGTVAQTTKSDCDYWVSVKNDELGPEGLELLSQKCKAIEEWALERDTEVYFFLMDIDQTRENSFDSAAEEESAGSALKLLLKDELFRTHIMVAGKMPLWWLIPPGLTEEGYREYVDAIYKSRKINPNLFIDLGYISVIPKSEIFGACLWQMNKALDSPFKSVIKFAYLELLLRKEDEALPLFSDRIKCYVTFPERLKDLQEEVLELENVDPYLLLAREIVAFYKQEKTEKKRDGIIRECLILKTLEAMALHKKKTGKKEQLSATMALMQKWQLLPDDWQHFTNIQFWNFTDLNKASVKVHNYLTETYKLLRWILKEFQKKGTKITITERDLSILGRKLFTFYQVKENKVEYIRSLSRESMQQDDITLHISRFEGMDYYYALQGEHDTQSVKTKTDMMIRRETALIPLLTWMYINGILNKKTKLHLTKNYLSISLVDIQDLVAAMMNSFPLIPFAHISADQLLKQETIAMALVVINMAKEQVRGSKALNSTIISTNSYGEFFIQDYTTLVQLKNAIHNLLTQHYVSRWNNNLNFFIPDQSEIKVIQSMLEK